MIDTYIGLGSNLGNSIETLKIATQKLAQLPSSRPIAISQFYQSKAIGPGEQPDYINAAMRLETRLEANTLLDHLQRIELEHHRERGTIRWTARTLDLDLLLYGNVQIQSERLCVPHPHIADRNFVLLPLKDLNEQLTFPNGTRLPDLIKETPWKDITSLPDHPPHTY